MYGAILFIFCYNGIIDLERRKTISFNKTKFFVKSTNWRNYPQFRRFSVFSFFS